MMKFLTLYQWRVRRYEDGWCLLESELKASEKNPDKKEYQVSKSSPEMVVCPVIIVSSDIHTLTLLTKSQTPTLIHVTLKDVVTYFYVYVDARESGYGSSLQLT